MSIQIIHKNQQGTGAFNGGEILENKPIGFPQDGGKQKPYSNLFYWAHAWAEKDSIIGLHPHQGFEIMSFVLKGDIEHYDTQLQDWKMLNEGDVQIIRSGAGISHAEKLFKGSHIFQIWFDPNLRQSLQKPASYDDYKFDSFPIQQENGFQRVIFGGEGSPLEMDSQVKIHRLDFEEGNHQLPIEEHTVNSFYVLHGAIQLNGERLEQDDFFRVKDMDQISLSAEANTQLFLIQSPLKLTYPVYAQQMQHYMAA